MYVNLSAIKLRLEDTGNGSYKSPMNIPLNYRGNRVSISLTSIIGFISCSILLHASVSQTLIQNIYKCMNSHRIRKGSLMQARDLEWGWSDSPILLPLAYQPREWNAAFIAMHIAEYSGSQLIVYHVSLATESASAEFREEVRSLAEKLRVKVSFVEEKAEDGSFDSISRMIVTQAMKQNAQAIIMPAHKEGF